MIKNIEFFYKYAIIRMRGSDYMDSLMRHIFGLQKKKIKHQKHNKYNNEKRKSLICGHTFFGIF